MQAAIIIHTTIGRRLVEFSSKRGKKNINGAPRLASERLYANLARVGKNGNWLKTQNARKRPMAIVSLGVPLLNSLFLMKFR